MKHILAFVLVVSLLGLTGCIFESRKDEVLHSLGDYDREQLWTHGEFQDFTDFGIYTFSSVEIEQNDIFSLVTTDNIPVIHGFIDNFESWIQTFRENDPNIELVLNYAFDRNMIDSTDYFYIYEKDGYTKYGYYDVWFFDRQTSVLYYFHNNI